MALCARDPISDTGRLRIVTRSVQLGEPRWPLEALRGGPAIELRVEDEGCGMDEETQLRIFEPFFTTKACDRGTGIGLSKARGIGDAGDGEAGVLRGAMSLPGKDEGRAGRKAIHAPAPLA